VNLPSLENFGKLTENNIFELAEVPHHDFAVATALLSLAVALIGFAAAYAYYWRNLGPHRLTERSPAARWGYKTLIRRYYLDDLYTDGIVASIKGPVARVAYWFNQRVIDGVVNGVGIGARRSAWVVYDVIDQKVVDGVVNGAGLTAEESGGILRFIQTGRVQQYAALLFGAVAAFGLALVLLV
jgi:NADH-quinone oxidoreductase subunit L